MITNSPIQAVEHPKSQFILTWIDRPDWWDDLKILNSAVTRSDCTDNPCELYGLPDGRQVEVWHEGCLTYYCVYSSGAARGLTNGSHPRIDPEGRGGRFYPSDYKRLKITHPDVPSDVSVTGRQHSPRCECQNCGKVVSVYDVKWGWNAEYGYLPFCDDSCFEKAVSDQDVAEKTIN